MSIPSKLGKEYKVRDPIYGFVKLDAQEMEIVNSEYFQRLRRIRQLSLTDMVYPSANHTRFEHSLGVVQMASDMFDNIVSKAANRDRLGLQTGNLARLRKVIRLAALLHDIGHAPFSHAGEDSMPLLPKDHVRYKSDKALRYEHEDYSIAAVKFIFRDYIENHPLVKTEGIKAEEIASLLGDETVPPTWTSTIWGGLISGQLDADRADYLLRDSLHLGVGYGNYDRNRLVNCMTIGSAKDTGSCFLAIEAGGWHVAESLVIARYQMFSQVYFHPVRRAFDYHVGCATKEVLRRRYKDGLFPPPTSEGNMKKYLSLDDWTMYGAFKDGKGGEHGHIILTRTPYKCKKEWLEDLPLEDREVVSRDLAQYKGFLDEGAATSWYKLDKDITIYDESENKSYPLTYRSKLVKAMPGLPKTVRLFICQEGEGANYEFKREKKHDTEHAPAEQSPGKDGDDEGPVSAPAGEGH